jgi:hypothetical protein
VTDTSTPQQIAAAIADRLGETEAGPRRTIARIVQELGAERALALLQETLQIEAADGMLLPDGSRRRTPGGVFFSLVKERLAQAGEKQLVARLFWRWQGAATQRASSAVAPASPPATWAERGVWLAALGEGYGEAKTVKVTLIGRPARVVEQEGFTLLKMQHNGPLPSLPKGIPVPAKVPPTTYIVYIAAKQWRGVAEALKNEEDALIVEGVQFYDADHKAITVFATNTTTKLREQAKRAAPPPKS